MKNVSMSSPVVNAGMDTTEDWSSDIRFAHALHGLDSFVPRTAFVKPTTATTAAQPAHSPQLSLSLH